MNSRITKARKRWHRALRDHLNHNAPHKSHAAHLHHLQDDHQTRLHQRCLTRAKFGSSSIPPVRHHGDLRHPTLKARTWWTRLYLKDSQ